MKATAKNVSLALAVLAAIIAVLALADAYSGISVMASDTYLKVYVVDLDGSPVHNACVSVCGNKFYTDNKGLSPSIELTDLTNAYDPALTEWYTVNVAVQTQGYVPAFVFNCVVYSAETRRLTVKIYPADDSDLPYVCYVESPPDQYIKSLLGAATD